MSQKSALVHEGAFQLTRFAGALTTANQPSTRTLTRFGSKSYTGKCMVLTIVGVFITNIVMSLNTALHRGGREGVGYS